MILDPEKLCTANEEVLSKVIKILKEHKIDYFKRSYTIFVSEKNRDLAHGMIQSEVHLNFKSNGKY